jgi:hypothetical protein
MRRRVTVACGTRGAGVPQFRRAAPEIRVPHVARGADRRATVGALFRLGLLFASAVNRTCMTVWRAGGLSSGRSLRQMPERARQADVVENRLVLLARVRAPVR